MPDVFSYKAKESFIEKNGKNPNSDKALFSETPDIDMQQNIFDKNYYTYDTINSIIVKIIQPKKVGDRLTGMYIRNLKDSNSFSIYSPNLDSSANNLLLNICHSISYKPQ